MIQNFKQVVIDYKLLMSKRLFETEQDIFYSNSKKKLPKLLIQEEFGFDMDNPFGNEYIYLAALVKKKIEQLTEKRIKFQNLIFNKDNCVLFYYFTDLNDIKNINNFIQIEQIKNLLKII